MKTPLIRLLLLLCCNNELVNVTLISHQQQIWDVSHVSMESLTISGEGQQQLKGLYA